MIKYIHRCHPLVSGQSIMLGYEGLVLMRRYRMNAKFCWVLPLRKLPELGIVILSLFIL
jgi:hypothetical protein